MRRHSRRSSRDVGQSLVEFAMVLPILAILVFGIIDFGMGLRAYITVAQATREGARYASVGNAAGTFTSGPNLARSPAKATRAPRTCSA